MVTDALCLKERFLLRPVRLALFSSEISIPVHLNWLWKSVLCHLQRQFPHTSETTTKNSQCLDNFYLSPCGAAG